MKRITFGELPDENKNRLLDSYGASCPAELGLNEQSVVAEYSEGMIAFNPVFC